MKHISLSRLFLFSCLSSAPILAVANAVERVEVYPSGATVVRSVILSSEAVSSGELRVDGLPSTLVDSSIGIRSIGDATVALSGFSFLPNENPVDPDDPRTEELRDRVEAINAKLRLNKEEQDRIRSRVDHYEGLAFAVKESLKEEAKTESYELALKAWEQLESVRIEGQARLAELNKAQNEFRIDLQKANEDLNELREKLHQLSGVLVVGLSGNAPDGAELEISYNIRQAGWSPVYEIRALPAQKSIQWVYKARIWQRSGEDWKGVTASLKSTNAIAAGTLPDLPPWFLQKAPDREEEVFELQAFSVRTADKMARAPMAASEMAIPESTTTSFFMVLPKPLDLESGRDGGVVREAFTKSLESTFWSKAVPELSSDAWLMGGTTNDLGWPILPGEAYTYIDGQLVSRKFMKGYGSGDDIELALGKNEKIAIERKERLRKESETGLIGKKKRHEIKYETTVTNNMAVSHRVVLEDRFPLSRNEEIVVERIRPEGVTPEEGTGIFEWERSLAPGQSAVMITEYKIAYPADWNVYPRL